MFKRVSIILIAGIFIFGMSKLSFAMMCGDHRGSQQLAQAHGEHEHGTTETAKEAGLSDRAVNVGNKICPVSGEKIEEKTKATYEYAGKIYNFCCPMCIDMFKNDPVKYIKKVEEELQAKPKEEVAPQGMHEGHQH